MVNPDGPPTWAEKFSAAFHGIREAWRLERSLRWHGLFALLVFVLGIVLQISLSHMAMIALAVGLVLTAELINTAIETVVDLVMPEQHPLARRAKDIAAGAVLVASMTAGLVGIIVFEAKIVQSIPLVFPQ